jgi:methylthioribose-1-phosphate isomerase
LSTDPLAAPVIPVAWGDDAVLILDQTRLPFEEVVRTCSELPQIEDAIRELAVRGAPALGVAAGYAMALAARTSPATSAKALHRDLRLAQRSLDATRPTAVNIAWATDRVMDAVRGLDDPAEIQVAVLAAARAIEEEDRSACDAMGLAGADLVPDEASILTHCNTGHLCTAGIGTAQGVIETAHRSGKRVHVWVDETRPILQGARLTAWELQRLGIPMTLVADNAAASLMAAGKVDLVITGADRVAANGDSANKVGTYGLAVLARHHKIPFYIAAPVSTVDLQTHDGGDIAIEDRDPAEVVAPRGVPFAPAGTPAANPAFDVTPGSLITAIVTERGVVRPPYRQSLKRLVREGRQG